MPPRLQVWDNEKDGGAGFVEFYSLSGREAIKNNPQRYSLTQPEPPAPKPEPARLPEPAAEASTDPAPPPEKAHRHKK